MSQPLWKRNQALKWAYPVTDLDRPGKLLSLLGTFWSRYYPGREQVQAYCQAVGQAYNQFWFDLLESISAFCRFTVPIFHTENWYLLKLRRSELGEFPALYGEAGAFGEGLRFGRSGPGRFFVWKVPEDLEEIPFLFNRITAPSVSYQSGLDYFFDRKQKRLVFLENPFADPRWTRRSLTVPDPEGEPAQDEELLLWVYRGKMDWLGVYKHWGYILGETVRSSSAYKTLVNTILDSLLDIAGSRSIDTLLSLWTGLPLVQEQTETIEAIQTSPFRITIATDQHVYHLSPGAQINVQVGQTLHCGDSFCSNITVYDPGRQRGTPQIEALILDEPLLKIKTRQPLLVRNQVLPCTTFRDSNDRLFWRFTVDGLPEDVETFWAEVARRGLDQGKTLEQVVARTNLSNEDIHEAQLPTELNPLAFLYENLWTYNTTFVKIIFPGSPPGDDTTIAIPPFWWRQIASPERWILVCLEIPAPPGEVLPQSSYGDLGVERFDGGSSDLTTSSGPSLVVEHPAQAYLVSEF
ncbi:MAG: hypothetical protein QW299_07240 [Candidatus Caldarchaeum sp.]